ncbi:MAG: HAD family hydrolase [Leptolyngbyaceae cyanobacterium bins.59]|nr:HAD family hydrolase [Leptolyngbyaceae cyanobacterium bins.59]
MTIRQPQVIFLDAVGTLFGVKKSVGHVYQEIAQQFGVAVEPDVLNQAFHKSFQAGGLPAFPGIPLNQIRDQEFNWWQTIALSTFQQAGVLDQFPDFTAFFKVLFSHFETADPWVLYPDVIPALQQWQNQGIRLGVLSNFDSRLYTVLEALELKPFFTSITVSTQVGVAKPEQGIFQHALKQQGCAPEAAWHIGDSYEEDYQAARRSGLRGIWLRRNDPSVPLRRSDRDIEDGLGVATSLTDVGV